MRHKLGYHELNWSIPDFDEVKSAPSYEAVCMMCAERFGSADSRWENALQSLVCTRCGGRIWIEAS